ncbi:hypothetical protein THRCLA_08163 [Thraustotheca clavata]|uniref:Rab-GAP TBC domain-containing protein n=1 Tax=Thraustotheca clavata TaxID=74557 RepID=A0A1V9Z962_9STRA|nr:hypothetical protein THRCLA_08163 [Thraustotheca clavata]
MMIARKITGDARTRNFSMASASSVTSVNTSVSCKNQHATAATEEPTGVPWVPDRASDECMGCQVAFSTFRRKHHCRNCGALVCSSCSRGRARLNGLEQKSRVCDICQRIDLPEGLWQEWKWSIEILCSGSRMSGWWSQVLRRNPAVHMPFEEIEARAEYFQELKSQPEIALQVFEHAVKMTQDFQQIEIDVERTFGPNSLEMQNSSRSLTYGPLIVYALRKGKTWKDIVTWKHALRRVLICYVMFQPTIGYCQGMDYIAAILLYGSNWECHHAFRLLVALMEKYDLSSVCAPGLPLLNLKFYQLDELVHYHLPELHHHLSLHGIHPNTYASGWVLTLFASFKTLHPGLVLSFFDGFFAKGWKSWFRVALAILATAQQRLLQTHTPTALIELLNHELPTLFPENDEKCREFFLLANHFKVTNAALVYFEDNFDRNSTCESTVVETYYSNRGEARAS